MRSKFYCFYHHRGNVLLRVIMITDTATQWKLIIAYIFLQYNLFSLEQSWRKQLDSEQTVTENQTNPQKTCLNFWERWSGKGCMYIQTNETTEQWQKSQKRLKIEARLPNSKHNFEHARKLAKWQMLKMITKFCKMKSSDINHYKLQ